MKLPSTGLRPWLLLFRRSAALETKWSNSSGYAPRRALCGFPFLIAGDFEITLDVAVIPSAGKSALIGKDIVQFTVDDEMYGIA